MSTVNDGSARFFAALDELVRGCEIVVDRPKGQPHPRLPRVIYPLDYGYLSGTTGGDGGGIDVFVGTAGSGTVTGVLLTVDLAKGDAEMKVLVDCSPGEVETARAFTADTLGIGGHLVVANRS